METVTDFILLGSKITADGDCSHEIKRKRHLFIERKVMTNLDSILKSRHLALYFCQHGIRILLSPPTVLYSAPLQKESWGTRGWNRQLRIQRAGLQCWGVEVGLT